MARQARAEITRDSVLAGAADVFLRLGYANASLSEIISQSNVTKGALYFHFGSKEELARAVVDQGNERLRGACQGFFDPRVPALEAAIGITYVVADLTMNDPMVGAMLKLTHQIGDYRGASGENITKTWGETQMLLAERAIAQGDLKPDLDPETIGLLLQEMTAGVHITAVGTESIDQMAVRMERMWYFLLPSIVPDEKVAYFREFAARRLRRYVP
ncbi:MULTISPECIES: TetR/AcrR family transcriptional regulator [Nocardia]|uniref:TetR/AcrR family transcriptional regulator n=1 Tax=Nocardia TaxID=1817 RepID=UPI0007EAED5B|nr:MULTISPECIES: TetR/AcrR family transcriptional regulator [Nocardia]MBF6277290.1 TetR/AcrR family transcriptional regulator [Nocardia nova]OBA49309.1 TetR family transcriptional regulator [Nocardia sp. 852002-51101_SCH5132738]OBB53826.1 TetR family transcriptional regulator [Nocardia sp. 852002-51244_SCH5132740]OBF70260.1 TetR family transcriptional regulator [Mycobacterium sp. 852002-51759_SCH5129042]